MAETPLRELQPASENPWYRLATAREDHADNTRRWNGYMRHLIGEGEAANLKRGDGTPIELPLLSPDEIERIAAHLPFPRRLPSMIYLAGLLFAEAVNFQDFYFPAFVDFGGSRFAGEASFTRSTFVADASFARSRFERDAYFTKIGFGGNTNFEAITFAGTANFAGSTFERTAYFSDSTFVGNTNFEAITFAGTADFAGSTFGGDADFAGSIFEGIADFAGSIFEGIADFTESIFKRLASFTGSTFKRLASFTGRTFAGDANFENVTFAEPATFAGSTFAGAVDFSNSKYEGKTSFQNVTFTVAPLFFETTLHEDTNWTEITWPDKPADKEDATEYVRRYDRLALMMSTLKQPDNEHQFFRLSMRAKEVRDGWGISTGLSRLYGLFFCYGWGLKRALGLWVLHILLGAGYLWGMALWQMNQPLSGLTALAISFSNSLPFLGLQRGPAKNAYASFDTLTGFNILGGIQSVIGPLLLFFLLLTIRNRFRLR